MVENREARLHLLDTSVWIRALRRSPHPAVQAHVHSLLRAGTVATCGQVILELLGGTITEAEYGRLDGDLRGVEYLETLVSDWRAAARLTFTLRRSGLTIPAGDVLLAAIAMRTGATLVHIDEHFDRIAPHTGGALLVENLSYLVI